METRNMDYKNRVITPLLFSTFVGGTAWAESTIGLNVTGGNQHNADDVEQLEYSGNTERGINAHGAGSNITIAGKGGDDSFLRVNGNNTSNGWASGIWSESGALINITNMNMEVMGNGLFGLVAMDGGQININGDGAQKLSVSKNNYDVKNEGDGILSTSDSKKGVESSINIKNMNIEVRDQFYQGIAAWHGSSIHISSDSGNNTLEVYDTRMTGNEDRDRAKGIHAKESNSLGNNAQINIKDMNIISNNNELEGLVAADSGVIHIESTKGTNTLTANQNRNHSFDDDTRWTYGAGLLAHGASKNSTNKQAGIIIENMSVEASENGHYGLYVRDGGFISISGDGSQKLDIIGNKSTVSGTFDAGIAVDGKLSTAQKTSDVSIKNMEVTIKDNGLFGIDISNGGTMSVSSTRDKTLTVSGNQSGNPENNEGIGIHVAGNVGENRSQLNIVDMNVLIDGSPDAGVKVVDGAIVNIGSTTGKHVLKANDNDNHGTNKRYNEGAGLFAFDNDGELNSTATLNIVGMDIEAINNGSYGVVSENAQINIYGHSHSLDVGENGRFGVLAKDGGDIKISGMNVFGDSTSDALIGIEREGMISFAGSRLTTNNDSLFYAWSDSDTQTSQFKLDNSIAIGNGSKLAYFNAHNSVLEATDSYLENAIVTNTNADISSTVSLNSSTWAMKDSSNMTNLNAGESTIDMRKYQGYTTLTAGSLASNRSTYLLNTYFDEPGLTTDKIIVDGGAATGSDNVLKVHATGYAPGTQVINGYGIQVVNLDNATDKSVDFSLYGGVVDSGAWDYYLHRAADDNYYLQTDQQATTTAKTITNIPAIHLSIVKTGMSEFRHRITELREYEVFHPNEVWVRTFGKHLKVDDSIDSKMNLYGIELGYDKEVHENEDNKYYAGIMAGYMYADNIKHHNSGYPDGSARANTPSVGIYGVWDNSDGWYSYGTLRYFWSRMKAQNYTSAGEQINYKPNRNFIAATFELGKQYEDIIDEKSKWIIEPKVALGYAYADSKSFKTNINTDIHYGSSESFTTRAAVLLGYNDKAESGEVYEPYIEVGVNREWLGKTDVTYAGGRFQSEQKGNGVDFAVGLRARTSENWSFIGSLGYETGQVNQGIGGQLGVRYSW
ncbi:autotransporter outer membrane beta-barrel domain-containing protein [Enterobacteriaceae bacterium 89]|nr:autotransporter outer membrane beta-barrel domain-containing protein [Enterobacteriaceae bacterium 89]